MIKLWRRLESALVWRWDPCSDCGGNPKSVATWSDPWGCSSCYNGGVLPSHRWPWDRSALWRKLVRHVPAVRP